MADKQLCTICEKADAEAWWSLLEAAETDYKERYNVSSKRIGGVVIGASGAFDVVALNRAVGVQIDHDTSPEEIRQIIKVADECGSRRFAIQLCPTSASPEVIDILKDAGFKHFNNWTKLIRKGSEPLGDLTTDIDVRRIDAAQAETFARIVCTSFGWPGLLRQWMSRTVGRDGWHHYMAFRGDEPIATGAMFVHDRVAWFGFASTAEQHRRLGAQTALIHRRLRDAQAAGCLNVVVETAEDTPEKHNPSYHNLLKFGFALAYQRPNYLKVKDLQH